MRHHRRGTVGLGVGFAALFGVGLWLTPAPDGLFAQPQFPPGGETNLGPETTPENSDKAIKELWRSMRSAYNRQQFSEVCESFDALRKLGQDVSKSSATAGYAYLRCARSKASAGDMDGADKYLSLSIQYGGEKEEHDHVRAILDRIRGIQELERGNLEPALRLLEIARKRGIDMAESEAISATLTQFAYEMHGRDDDVRALAALDAALLFYPHNRQAELLRREIWMWDYGAWIVVVLVVFLLAIYFVFRQWREVRIREFMDRGF